MERRSSMRNSGFDSLFRGAEARAGSSDDARGEQGGEGAHTPSAYEPDSTPDVGRQLIQPSRTFPAVIRVVDSAAAASTPSTACWRPGSKGVEFIAVNTDVQALQMCEADHKLRIGRELTKGLGGGSDPEVGRDAALAAYDEIKGLLNGSDMVFITAGEGGGTGTGQPRPWWPRSRRERRRSDHRRGVSPVRLRGQAAPDAGDRGYRRAARAGGHRHRGAQRQVARGGRSRHLDGGGAAAGRRRAPAGRAGHLRLGDRARADQPRPGRRAHHHDRGRHRPHGHRRGRRGERALRRPPTWPSTPRCSRPPSTGPAASC